LVLVLRPRVPVLPVVFLVAAFFAAVFLVVPAMYSPVKRIGTAVARLRDIRRRFKL
jgi:hypothetical protein